jgi:hypothetical protein
MTDVEPVSAPAGTSTVANSDLTGDNDMEVDGPSNAPVIAGDTSGRNSPSPLAGQDLMDFEPFHNDDYEMEIDDGGKPTITTPPPQKRRLLSSSPRADAVRRHKIIRSDSTTTDTKGKGKATITRTYKRPTGAEGLRAVASSSKVSMPVQQIGRGLTRKPRAGLPPRTKAHDVLEVSDDD